ncbi:MAG: gamma-glutamylcyclotransferase [Desulfobacterales bacterium]|nr:gamma-glutamylcyclotransferase [Desulfobacterales bacterium]
MIQRLFVYGTLGPGRPNEHVLSDIGGFWEKGSVKGTLYQEGWGADMGYPGIVLNDDGDTVQGFVFNSENLYEHWTALDGFEGEAYQRVLTTVKLADNSRVDAYIYELKRK